MHGPLARRPSAPTTPSPRAVLAVILVLPVPAAAITVGDPALTTAYRVFLSSTNNAEDTSVVPWCGSNDAGCTVVGGGPQSSVLYDQQGQLALGVATSGVLQARADAAWPVATVSGPFFATAYAQLTDTITVDPGLDAGATSALLRFRLLLDGELSFTTNGVAELELQLRLQAPGQSWFARFLARDSEAGLSIDAASWLDFGFGSVGDPFGTFEYYQRLPTNVPIEVTWTLLATASTPANNADTRAGSASVRLDQSATWLGLDIIDGNFDPLAGAVVTSASGFNWQSPTPIPLPGTAWLLLGGAAALGALGRRAGTRRYAGDDPTGAGGHPHQGA